MPEGIRDSSIKLFGMTIVVPEQRQSSSATSVSSSHIQDESEVLFKGTNHGDNSSNSIEETSTDAAASSGIRKDSLSQTKSNEDEETNESGVYQGKTTLDKPDKSLSCPRCISKDTKFCYYNNSNHNQPRHFCKNCQRYWTNGEVMRNLPIGSGRRKTKCVPIPNYPHDIMTSSDAVNGMHLASAEQKGFLIYGSDEYKTSEHSGVFGSSGISVVFYPTTPYWGCALSQPFVPHTSSTLGKRMREEMITSPSNSEKENLIEKTNAKRSVLVPKTLRFDIPNEAAKSSIWSALGIKNEKAGCTNGASLFKAFEGKGVRNSNVDIAKMVLQANPAALHRSLNFHESAYWSIMLQF